MDDHDRLMANAMDGYNRGIAVLESGDVSRLEALASELNGFPGGDDPYLGRRWITNAIDVGSKAAVQWLLGKGVNLDFTDEEGYSPVHSAIDRDLPDRHEILEMLLNARAAVNRKGFNDWTPAHLAAARDDVEALRLLVRHGADLAIRTNIHDDATPLEEARILGKVNAVEYLESVV